MRCTTLDSTTVSTSHPPAWTAVPGTLRERRTITAALSEVKKQYRKFCLAFLRGLCVELDLQVAGFAHQLPCRWLITCPPYSVAARAYGSSTT